MRHGIQAAGALVCLLLAPAAYAADEKYPQEEYNKHITSAQTVGALGSDLFGEQVNFFTGATEFHVTDISLPGQGPAVGIGRRFEVKDRGTDHGDGIFEDWDLEIPHLYGVFAHQTLNDTGWLVSTGQPTLRCSTPTSEIDAIPPTMAGPQGGSFDAIEYWSGNHLYLPGQGSQPMLLAVASNPNKPTTGGPYRWTTSGNWHFSCLTGSANNVPGETFLAIDPSGTRYWFDWVVKREAVTLLKPYGEPPGLQAASGKSVDVPNPVPQAAIGSFLKRDEVWMLPTRIEDRFGNAVTYTYDSANPWHLTQITASDGRQLTLTYTNDVVTLITDGQRDWTYAYSDGLTAAIYPDGSRWSYDLDDLRRVSIFYLPQDNDTVPACDNPGTVTGMAGGSGSITHPSGAVGTFAFSPVRMGRSHVPRNVCWAPFNGGYTPREALYPASFDNIALIQKQITGPGQTTATWNYAWGPANLNYAEDCTNGQCPTTRTVTVNGPTGWIRYTHSNKFFDGEGKLLLTEEGAIGSSTPLRSTEAEYLLSPSGQAYPAQIGIDINPFSDDASEQYQPLISRSIQQQGRDFTWQVPEVCGGAFCFDQFARPTKVVRASGQSFSRTETTTYHDNTSKWVLGQIASVSCNVSTPSNTACNGDVVSATTFDSTSALPLTVSAFGKLQSTMTYYGDGSLKTVKDGNNRITTFSSWKRGIPQSIVFADGTSRSAVVNDAGWITSSTDENGYATTYAYDDMGRLTLIDYPDNDSTTWNDTTRTFEQMATVEYGIGAGHWREKVETGDAIRVTYYDGMWRPLLLHEYDDDDVSATTRFTKKAFDADGRVIFASYPSASSSPSTGVWTDYDALGRITSVAQDTELDPALQVTTTTYNTGFTTTVTNPRGASTTTHYMTYDQPSTDWPTIIVAPEDATTTITRDPFGKPLSIVRGETP